MVVTYIESASGIVTVRVRAFRRDDALNVANAVLRVSEQLVNQMTLRARTESMRHAEEEVRRADTLMGSALRDLARYRDDEGLIDPVKTGGTNRTIADAIVRRQDPRGE